MNKTKSLVSRNFFFKEFLKVMSFLSEAKLNCDVSFPFDVAGIYF